MDLNQVRAHTVAAEDGHQPTGKVEALCGETVRAHGGPLSSPDYHYLTIFSGARKRYDHECARCVKAHEKAASA